MENKLTLPFVNNGKPFTVNNWTVEQHEKALELMIKENSNLDNREKDSLFRYYVIYIGLLNIDPEVAFEDVRKLHVENIMELFELIYYAGKIDIFFHKPNKKK